MKILLIRYHDKANINTREAANLVDNMGALPPLGIMYIAAYLEKYGYQVSILDVLMLGLDTNETRKHILELSPDIVGITVTTPEIQGALEVAKIAKETGAKVVLGGTHLSIFPNETLSSAFVDYGIMGDGEVPMLKLVNAIENNKDNYHEIEGLVYKKDGKVFLNNTSIFQNLDNLPMPARHLLPLGRYSRADALFPMATTIISRGCPYKCGFCFRSESQMKVRLRSPEEIVKEMEHLVKGFGVREIILLDDILTLNREHITKVCNLILKKRLRFVWQGATRVNLVDEEILALMRKAGCKQLKYGVESGDPNILKLMNKRISISEITNAFKLTRKAGIRSGAYFIIGYARENCESIRKTIEFSKSLKPDYVMFYPGVPLPKTYFHDLAVEDGLIDPNYWREYTLGLRNDKLPYLVPDCEVWVKTAFREFYSRPSYLLRKAMDISAWKSVIKQPKLLGGLFFTKIRHRKNFESQK